MKYFIFSLAILAWSCNEKPATRDQVTATDSTTSNVVQSDTDDFVGPDLEQIRKDFISEYDSTFETTLQTGPYSFVVKHFCTFDSAITVPAGFNFDTGRPFRTHNFESTIFIIRDGDTLSTTSITKPLFHPFLFDALDSFAVLFDPSVALEDDSLKLFYSISIPVTDVGVGVALKMDTTGNYRIFQ